MRTAHGIGGRPSASGSSARSIVILVLLGLCIGWTSGCASTQPRRFSGKIVWEVNDRHPIAKPDKRWAPIYWGAVDHLLFRPISHLFLLRRSGPAKNANALGQVPNSSWYTNRLSRWSISPRRVALGPCEQFEMERGPRWVVHQGRLRRGNRGFVVDVHRRDGTTTRYKLKVRGARQTERATAAEAIASRIYWAAGFETPCNRVIYVDPEILELADDAILVDKYGAETPMSESDIERVLRRVPHNPKGRFRTVASPSLPGKPLGPFSYEGVRHDDPNDVIPHEDRRELRGSKLIAAWLNHFDTRQRNTATTFMQKKGSDKGYVQHFLRDFDDSLGARWVNDQVSRRFGRSFYFDFEHVFADMFGLGLIHRPWEDVESDDDAPIFNYFGVTHFEPKDWKEGFPNIAFGRMDARDAFWATNIISRFTDTHIERLVAVGRFTKEVYGDYLTETLIGRRDRIVRTYFAEMSPLVEPEVGGGELCVIDAWVSREYGPSSNARYERRFSSLLESQKKGWDQLDRAASETGEVCVDLPPAAQRSPRLGDLVVEVRVSRKGLDKSAKPTRFHLRPDRETNQYRLVGILRVGDAP